MSLETATVTIVNEMTDIGQSLADPAFDLKVVTGTSYFFDDGTASADPEDAPSMTLEDPNNGGIYSSGPKSSAIKGIIAYILPGGVDIIVIYLDTSKVCIGTKPKGTELNDKLLEEISKLKPSLTSTFVLRNASYTFDATGRVSVRGHTNSATITFTVTGGGQRPTPSPSVALSTTDKALRHMEPDVIGTYVEDGIVYEAPGPGPHSGGVYVPEANKPGFKGAVGYAALGGVVVVFFQIDRVGLSLEYKDTTIDKDLVDRLSKKKLTDSLKYSNTWAMIRDTTKKSDINRRTADVTFGDWV